VAFSTSPFCPLEMHLKSFLFFTSAELLRRLYIFYNTFSLSRFLLHSCRTERYFCNIALFRTLTCRDSGSLSGLCFLLCVTQCLVRIVFVVHNTMSHCTYCVCCCT
jgi:hypothetical protein